VQREDLNGHYARMGEVVWLINCTLDGRCGHEDVIADDDLHRHATQTLEGVDVVLFGRNTFELLEPHWSTVARGQTGTSAENEFASAIDRLPKVVFSRSLVEVGWNGRVVHSDPADEVRRLRKEVGRLVVQASPGLAAHLREARLIDRCRFVLQPLVAGAGPAMFGKGEAVSMRLDNAVRLVSGAIALDYTLPED
jgi:dihydrofolate reductase